MTAAAAEGWAQLRLAVQFLTRVPVGDPGYSPRRMAASIRWHPAVGALVGGCLGAVWLLAATVLPPVPAVLVATAVGLALTGCFHEDGFADLCDGLGGATRERVLEIMRDSRLGTYGVAGLSLVLATRVATLVALSDLVTLVWVLVGAHAASRAASVLVVRTSTYARDHGTGKEVAEGVDGPGLALALVTGALALVPLVVLVGPWVVLAGVGGLGLGALTIRRVFLRRLGGYTGDCLGAVQQCADIGFGLGLLAAL